MLKLFLAVFQHFNLVYHVYLISAHDDNIVQIADVGNYGLPSC